MALRSPTQFHNDWGIFAPGVFDYSDLPNVLGSPNTSSALEVGDIATVSTTPPSKWYCTQALPIGSATWAQLTSSAPAADITPYRITVGCAAAPYNDTADICDFLDNGDGQGLDAAVAAANAFSAQTGPDGLSLYSVEVFVRDGVYDFSQLSSPTNPLTLGRGVSMLGTSSANVLLRGRDTGNQGMIIKSGRGRLSGFAIEYAGPPVSATSGEVGIITLTTLGGADLDSRNCILEDLKVNIPAINRPTQSLRACLDLKDNPLGGIGRGFDGLVIRDCFFTIPGDTLNASSGPADNVAAIRALAETPAFQDILSVITLDNVKLEGGDNAILNYNVNMVASNVQASADTDGGIVISLRRAGAHSSLSQVTCTATSTNMLGIQVNEAGQANTGNFSLTQSLIRSTPSTGVIGINLTDCNQGFVESTRVTGFATGIYANGGDAIDNVIIGNIFKTNTTPADVDLANNEFAHNIV